MEPYIVIRKGDWKLIYWYIDGKSELYNIPADISEKNNLAENQHEITKKLAGELGKYLKSVGAKPPIDKKSKIPLAYPDEILK